MYVSCAAWPTGSAAWTQLPVARLRALTVDAERCRPADIAKIVFYVVDWNMEKLGPLMEAAIEVFGEDFPVTASTLVGVATLFEPDWLIEIDVTAVLD